MVTVDKQKKFIVADAMDTLNSPEPLDMLEASDVFGETDTSDESGIGERVGQFTFTVRTAENVSSTDSRFNNRADALAAWLLAKWQHEQVLGHINN